MSFGTEDPVAAPACPVSHDFDPFGDAFQEDPGRALRAQQPVFFSEALGWYVVIRHEDIRAVFSDQENFSCSMSKEPITPLCPAAKAKLEEYDYKGVASLGSLDEPIHLIRRRKLAEPYKAKATAKWEPRIRAVQTDYIDRIVKRGNADLVADLFNEAPAVVAVEFMGIPEEDVAEVKTYSSGAIKFIFGKPTEEEQVETCELMGRSLQYARGLFKRLMEDPSGSGVLPTAVRAFQDEPENFDEMFVTSLGVTTLAAAHETTSSSLGNAMINLLSHLGSWEEICADPELIPGAVEECLRVGAPLVTGRRYCINDTVVGGVTIPAGSMVMLGHAGGNIDEAVFEDPGKFDIHRKNARSHLAFGYGLHACLGAPLARLQIAVYLEELSRRLPHMRLVPDQQFEFVPSSTARSPVSVLVEWDPAQNPLPEDRP